MSVFIEIAGLVTGMIVMLARLFRDRLVAMTVLIEVSGLVPGMFVMGTGFFLGHVRLPLAGSLVVAPVNARPDLLVPRQRHLRFECRRPLQLISNSGARLLDRPHQCPQNALQSWPAGAFSFARFDFGSFRSP